MRNAFERELDRLQQFLIDMGTRVDEIMAETITAFKTHDKELAAEVVKADSEIDQMENQIEQMCMNLIARQQPLARDLRTITATLKIITDIERIADQCADICEILTRLRSTDDIKPAKQLPVMMEFARGMFSRSITSYINRDPDLAKAVCAEDDVVDEMFEKLVIELSALMTESSESVFRAVNLMFITKYIERMADHATNVAEWTIYMVDGFHPDLNPHAYKIGDEPT